MVPGKGAQRIKGPLESTSGVTASRAKTAGVQQRRMLEALRKAAESLPRLLSEECRAQWGSVHVTYHPPRVERLWIQLGEARLFLQKHVYVGMASPTPRYQWKAVRYVGSFPIEIGTRKSNKEEEHWRPGAQVNLLTMGLWWHAFDIDNPRDDWWSGEYGWDDVEAPPDPTSLSPWDTVDATA